MYKPSFYTKFRSQPVSYFKRKTTKTKTFVSAISTDLAWAAAAYAYRINGNQFLKDEQHANKVVMQQELRDHLATNIDSSDVSLGQQARRYWQLNLTAKALKASLSEFERTVFRCAEKEYIDPDLDRLELAVIASQISAYIRARKDELLREDIDTTPIAPLGTRIKVSATVIKSVWSDKYLCYFITAKTECNRLIFFSYRNLLAEDLSCNIQGTVKSYRNDTSQLNRVRMVLAA